jgi:hypothetical protein
MDQLTQIQTNGGEGKTVDTLNQSLFLLLELPDRDQDLFVQHPGRGATEFTRFPELPVEIRLMIWRGAFRGPKLVPLISQWSSHLPTYRPPHPSILCVSRESRLEALKHYLMFFLKAEEYIDPNNGEYGPDGLLISHDMAWRSRQLPRVTCLKTGIDTLVMNLHHCCEQAVIPELRLFAQRAEQYPPITRLALINARISAFTWSLGDAFRPRSNNTPNFLGLICFHYLDELWIITADDALPDTFEEECRASLTKMFEWEKKRVPKCNIPEVIFLNSPNDLKARIRAELQ